MVRDTLFKCLFITFYCFIFRIAIKHQELNDAESEIEENFETTVFMKRIDGNLLEIDITERITLFSPLLLVYLTNIGHMDIAGCTFIDPDLFVDTIGFCTELKKLEMAHCTQFQEKHFSLMMTNLPELNYLDFHTCAEISFAAAYWIISLLGNLRCINFDPQNAVAHVLDWEILLRHFRMVHFGHNVRCQMPFYGNNWRIPDADSEENEE